MKAFFKSLFFILILVCPHSSCTNDTNETGMSELVIEGWIEEGGFPVVSIGQTFPASGNVSYNINDYLIKWAKVTVSDGNQTFTLTGGYDKDRFPPYKYSTYEMRGVAGKTYTLTVEYKNHYAYATTSIPMQVSLDSLNCVKLKHDTLFYIKAFFKECETENDHYLLFSKRESKDTDFLLSYLGCIDDTMTSPYMSIDVFRGKSITSELSETTSKYYASGDKVIVALRHVDKKSFSFWKSFMNQNSMSSNMFFPSTNNLESNIIGGKGYWCGSSSSYKTIIIPR